MKISEISQNQISSCFVEDSINQKLHSGNILRIKSGIDPSSPDIHLGHIVGLFILRKFIEMGHQVVFVIGDFTAQLGNGSNRKPLSLQQAQENAEPIIKFITKFLGNHNLEIHMQSEWFNSMKLDRFLSDMSLFSINDLVAHSTFRERLEGNNSLKANEITYPLLMALDSVVLKPDIEIGSLEQKFNLQFARRIMKSKGVIPEDFILNKRLPGIDGSEKMSKSENNSVGIFEDINIQTNKLMKIPDNLIITFWTLLTDKAQNEIEEEIKSTDDMIDLKKRMALGILLSMHDKKLVREAITGLRNLDNKTILSIDSDSIKSFILKNILFDLKLTGSIRESKQLTKQNAVRVNNQKVSDPNHHLRKGDRIGFRNKIITID